MKPITFLFLALVVVLIPGVAGAQAKPDKKADAAELYRQGYPYLSDTIHLVKQYEEVLREVGDDKEADKVNKRYRELLTIYARRRGVGR